MKYNLNTFVFYGGHQYEVVDINTDGRYTIKSTSSDLRFTNVVEDVLDLPLTNDEVMKRLKRL